MRNLFLFLFRFRGAFVFGILEIFCLYLFVTNSSYQRAAFFNSANAYAGQVLERRTQVADYFRLAEHKPAAGRRKCGPAPAAFPARQQPPRSRLRGGAARPVPTPPPRSLGGPAERPDTILLGLQPLPARDPSYPLIPARVINNMLHSVDNYLTLNVGSANGVERGQGVVAANGVVGRVKVVTEHYATVTSLLHSKTSIAAKIKRDGTFGTIRWLGDDPTHAMLDNVLRETKLVKGDTVVTSGYNAVFPAGIFIGTIDSFLKEPDKNFWTIRVRLGINFSNLTYVYVVKSPPKPSATPWSRTAIKPEGKGRTMKGLRLLLVQVLRFVLFAGVHVLLISRLVLFDLGWCFLYLGFLLFLPIARPSWCSCCCRL